MYSARQHANEVSSTSHILKLAELLLTDPEFRQKLKKVNVVVHPITNPDGAQLAYDLYKITPDFMLHAGYLGALGVDVTSAQWETDPIYPESTHPAEHLAHLAAGHLPQPARLSLPRVGADVLGVRGVGAQSRRERATGGACAAGSCPGFGYLDDPKYPRHKDAAFEIRRSDCGRI